jgi:hypothetical protein
MRKLLLLAALTVSVGATAQVATFEALPLAGTDTFYINTQHHLMDMGFNDGLMHFPYVYDTSFGGYWTGGYSYSNKTDSVTSGMNNMYSAKAAKGYNGSAKYAVFTPGYGSNLCIKTAVTFERFRPEGFYVTNSTYAYNSMRDGDGLAKKFGGATGNDADWFTLTAHGYANGAVKSDSVVFYLADFRAANNSQDYIIKDWTWVNLQALGGVDSIYFTMNSSDANAFGMLTPAYFCMDDFKASIPITNVPSVTATALAKVYPNPATTQLFVELQSGQKGRVTVYNVAGQMIAVQEITQAKAAINTASFAAGIYMLKVEDEQGTATMRFSKQ